MSRLEKIKKLENILERFLNRVADQELAELDRSGSIGILEEIARDSLKGRYVNNRLGEWFAKNNPILDKKRFTEPDILKIGNFLHDIETGLEHNDPETAKLTKEIIRWRSKGAVPRRKLVLKREPEIAEQDMTAKFMEMFNREREQLDYYTKTGDHILSYLDDALKSAEAGHDQAFQHLAGSIIYFLKINGYKIDPYVKRLKKLETRDEKSG